MFRDVPACSGMFRNVPCSWFYRRPAGLALDCIAGGREGLKRLNWEMKVQWNPALRTPALCGQFRLSRQKAHIFSPKLTRFLRTPVNPDNGHFSVSRVTNSHILSTLLYGHWLSTHCLFSLSHLCDNCRHCTLFK